jgi:hypothetical protein
MATANPHPDWKSTDWAQEMARLRTFQPRPIKKLFGTKGPSPEQLIAYKAEEKTYASKMQKKLLAEENEAFRNTYFRPLK